MFEPAIQRNTPPRGDDLIVLFAGNALILADTVDVRLPTRAELAELVPAETVHVGALRGVAVETLNIDVASLPSGWRAETLRPLHGRLSDAEWAVAGRAFQLAEWDRTDRFCGVCGASTERAIKERARICEVCSHRAYPRHSPAVIMRITRADEVLLGRSAHFPAGMFSTLAGFVDSGESAEDAVRREVREEAGIEISEPRWFGSQSWAFPHSLMLGFTAEWVSGNAVADPLELEDLRWFTRDDLPILPPPSSIARRLLDDWL